MSEPGLILHFTAGDGADRHEPLRSVRLYQQNVVGSLEHDCQHHESNDCADKNRELSNSNHDRPWSGLVPRQQDFSVLRDSLVPAIHRGTYEQLSGVQTQHFAHSRSVLAGSHRQCLRPITLSVVRTGVARALVRLNAVRYRVCPADCDAGLSRPKR
jgi:hypothetical protein